MALLLVAVVVVAVGLPLFAVWVARRPHWSRLRPGAEPDPWRDLVRRHGLSAGEAARIAEDVPRGRRLADPRLRPVAAEWARELLRQEQLRLPRDPRTRRVVVGVVVVWAATALGVLVHEAVRGDGVDVNWVSVALGLAIGAWAVRRRRALRRTVEWNDGPGTGRGG